MLRGRFFMNAMDELMDENENGGYFLRRETGRENKSGLEATKFCGLELFGEWEGE